MGKKQLVREVKRAALTRMEDAARTTADFNAVVKQWNHLDRNRERRERDHEISRPNEFMLHWDRIDANDKKGKLRGSFGAVIPPPLNHPWWRQLIQGDFIDTIYDNSGDMWQLVEDMDISVCLKDLTERQKVVVFLSAVRQCTPQQIACYQDKTDRAVRKLLTAAIRRIRDKLSPIIQEQIKLQYSI
ncbi:MAG TPA: hypothetical protein DEP23_16255 [Ruminococcaceae bacterium]|nr:hypothetical protein [Oscillospiraceae bacterium]